MVLFFICGVIAGAVVTRLYITYKNDNPLEAKISKLERIISELKEDNRLLEELNRKLRK